MMLSVMGSMDRTNEEYLRNTYGAWFGAIPDGRDEDRSFLERRDWLSQLGESVSYAQVKVSNAVSGAGTVDETFLELGRIRLRSGRLPEQPGEIAMEEDLLTALGYSAELGQTGTRTAPGSGPFRTGGMKTARSWSGATGFRSWARA